MDCPPLSSGLWWNLNSKGDKTVHCSGEDKHGDQNLDLIHHLLSTSGQDFSQDGTHEIDDDCDETRKLCRWSVQPRVDFGSADRASADDADANDNYLEDANADDDHYDAVVDGTVDDLW